MELVVIAASVTGGHSDIFRLGGINLCVVSLPLVLSDGDQFCKLLKPVRTP